MEPETNCRMPDTNNPGMCCAPILEAINVVPQKKLTIPNAIYALYKSLFIITHFINPWCGREVNHGGEPFITFPDPLHKNVKKYVQKTDSVFVFLTRSDFKLLL